MRGKETGVQCLCVWERERERKRTHVCVFVLTPPNYPPCDVCSWAYAHIGWERALHVCVCVCACACTCVCFVCVCVWLDRGVGVLYWKVLLSSPVQHAGLAPAVSHGAVPPSPLAICIRRRQAEMWQTNLAHTAPAASFTWTLPLAARKETQDRAQANTPAYTLRHTCPGFLSSDCTAYMQSNWGLRPVFPPVIKGIHTWSKAKGGRWWEGAFVALSFGQNSPESKYPPPRFSLPPRWSCSP